MKIFEEEILEPIARFFRFYESLPLLLKKRPKKLVDLGCGPRLRFLRFCSFYGYQPEEYIGVDPLLANDIVDKYSHRQDITIIKAPLDKDILIPENSVDCVVGFAFLEHIDNPSEIIAETIRILSPGGIAIFTTPSFASQAILEFLSFKLKLISPREIEEHKQYFDRHSLIKSIPKKDINKVSVAHRYFEFGLNNLFILKKK